MNLLTQDTYKNLKFTPRRTESFADSRGKMIQNTSHRCRVFSFNANKRIQINRKLNQTDLNSTKDSMNCTQTTKLSATATTGKSSRPLTATNPHKKRASDVGFDKFKLALNIPEEQKQSIFGPVVKKINTPMAARNSLPFYNYLSECPSTERKLNGISKYVIGKDIGKGAYAVVKSAINRTSNQKFAIKVYDKTKFPESSRMKNAYKEIQILSQLSHKNIIKLHEHHDSSDNLYLVLELVQGNSLSEYSKRFFERRIPEKEACGIFYQLMQAISYCHTNAISHRDVKFDNILLDINMDVKLIDFGFSTKSDLPSKVFCGTPSYMAPEIIQKVEYFGPPVDIWACGVVLFGMLCGYFPFKSQNDKDCYRKILSGLVYIPNFVSQGARELIEKMLKSNPESRITANEILKSKWFADMSIEKKEESNFTVVDSAVDQLVNPK